MKFDLIVARYKEDVEWTQSINELIKIKIYNKYEGENLLKNVGRESHTYLHHIISNYDDLADFTIFSQGSPIEHCIEFIKITNEICRTHKKIDFIGLSDGVITCDVNGRPHCGKQNLPLGLLYQWITDKAPPQVFISPAGAQFGVSKRLILMNKKSFYEKAIQSLQYDINPIEGFCFERMWPALFGIKADVSYSSIDYNDEKDIDVKNYLQNNCSGSSIRCLGKLGLYAD